MESSAPGGPDEVDTIIAAWGAARPDLDLAPLAVFSRLTRIARRLDRARSRAFERSGLASWEFDVLAVLRRGGSPYRQSPKLLVQQTLVSSGTMTNRIDRLVERGLVRRLTDPNDGRGVLVEMTQLGQTLVDAAMTRLTDEEERLLGTMTRAERERLAGLLRKLAHTVYRLEPAPGQTSEASEPGSSENEGGSGEAGEPGGSPAA